MYAGKHSSIKVVDFIKF